MKSWSETEKTAKVKKGIEQEKKQQKKQQKSNRSSKSSSNRSSKSSSNRSSRRKEAAEADSLAKKAAEQ